MAFSFGITPTLAFQDVSAVLTGESIDLCAASFDFAIANYIQISRTKLNDYVLDNLVGTVSDGTVALSANGATTFTSDDVTVSSALVSDLAGMAKGSAKATIAYALTGSSLGDIGELENDTTFDSLVDNSTIATSIVNAMNADAVVSVAEDILRNLGLSGGVSSEDGRDPSNPFMVGDALDFNMLVANGEIRLLVDQASDLDQSAGGATFFNDPVKSLALGVNEDLTADGTTGYVISNTKNSYTRTGNRYLLPATRIAPDNNSGAGIVGDDKGVLIRLQITVTE